jgi:hypothetical protein
MPHIDIEDNKEQGGTTVTNIPNGKGGESEETMTNPNIIE